MHCNLGEEALDCTVGRTSFRRGDEPVARQNTRWMTCTARKRKGCNLNCCFIPTILLRRVCWNEVTVSCNGIWVFRKTSDDDLWIRKHFQHCLHLMSSHIHIHCVCVCVCVCVYTGCVTGNGHFEINITPLIFSVEFIYYHEMIRCYMPF